MNEEWMTSVGLDIGTSTTKFILSRLKIGERGNSFTISHYEITERELLYESSIHRTPLLDEETIDPYALASLLEAEFIRSGSRREEIKSGAIIITGETANKLNAEAVVHLLAEQAGAFVVATAGADLEGILAGKGAGAQRRSKAMTHTVANIDIGGGTANIAWFRDGDTVATAAFHVGGRLIRLGADGAVLYVAPAIQQWLERRGWSIIKPGLTVNFSMLKDIAYGLAQTLLTYLAGKQSDEAEMLAIGTLPVRPPQTDEWMLSGGVAELMRAAPPLGMEDTAVYGDIGPLLAHAVLDESRKLGLTLVEAEQTVRATVIGAGMQSTELSGSTIHSDVGALPVRNVPVLKLYIDSVDDWEPALVKLFESGCRLYGTEQRTPFGLALTSANPLSYAQLRQLADLLISQLKRLFTTSQVVVIVCDQDIGKALGQLLSLGCRGAPSIVCIDGVRLDYGDYIDIGELIAGRTVPVIVKTLLFPNSSSGVTI